MFWVAPGKSWVAADGNRTTKRAQAHGRNELIQALARVPDATDPFAEKSLEVEDLA
jgi:hypothetical protein